MDNREKHELAMRKRIMRGTEKWMEHTRDLPPLSPGNRVLIQNQHGAGKAAKRWNKLGVILEDLGYNKYHVKVDMSGRATDCNHQFLKKITPDTPGMPSPTLIYLSLQFKNATESSIPLADTVIKELPTSPSEMTDP